MLKNSLVILVVSMFLGVFASGCARSTCETYCEWVEECFGWPLDDEECIEDCSDEYKEESSDCKAALRDLADCMDGRSCTAVAANCDGAWADADDQCSGSFWD